MDNFQVEVTEYGIRVARTATGQSVLFRRVPGAAILEADDVLQKPEIWGHEASFLAEAWKRAYAAASERGWLAVCAA